jgi:N-succinyldiaminopimelate aminotransferase
MADLSRLVPRMRPYATTIFGQMSAIAAEVGAVNLGQGFPDVDGPQELKDIAVAAILHGSGNQYPPAHGLPDLRSAISEHQQRHYALTVSPDTDVVVTTGASEALAAAVLALVDAGDEVIVLEPYFDLYAAIIAMAGATRVAVPLAVPGPGTGDGFTLDSRALADAVTTRTRMIIVNSPHNPTGMVLSRPELEAIAKIAIDNDLLVLSDEAYEHLVFGAAKHVPIATLPGMFERTVTIGSGGKSFSFTGWKVGWASGPTDLIAAVRVVRQHLSYVSGGPFQAAIAAGLRFSNSYFSDFAANLQVRRDLLSTGLRDLGFDVLPSDGTYFITSDIRPLGRLDGRSFCEWLVRDLGVAAIPIEVLADDEVVFAPYVRWTFCKRPEVLEQALDRLASIR